MNCRPESTWGCCQFQDENPSPGCGNRMFNSAEDERESPWIKCITYPIRLNESTCLENSSAELPINILERSLDGVTQPDIEWEAWYWVRSITIEQSHPWSYNLNCKGQWLPNEDVWLRQGFWRRVQDIQDWEVVFTIIFPVESGKECDRPWYSP